jgi:hypothetical protein
VAASPATRATRAGRAIRSPPMPSGAQPPAHHSTTSRSARCTPSPEPEPARCLARHLTAPGVERPPERLAATDQQALGPGARERDRGNEAGDHLPGVGGIRPRDRPQEAHVVAPHRHRLVRERGAAHVQQQRGVEDIRDLLLVQAHRAREPGADQARAHRMLRRQAEAQARRHRQSGEQVGEPQAGRHGPILPRRRPTAPPAVPRRRAHQPAPEPACRRATRSPIVLSSARQRREPKTTHNRRSGQAGHRRRERPLLDGCGRLVTAQRTLAKASTGRPTGRVDDFCIARRERQ